MDRQRQTRVVFDALTHAAWPDGKRDGFPGKVVAEMLAPAVLDAILPQVTTLRELEVLPGDSVVMWGNGDTNRLFDLPFQTYLEAVEQGEVITVVWQP